MSAGRGAGDEERPTLSAQAARPGDTVQTQIREHAHATGSKETFSFRVRFLSQQGGAEKGRRRASHRTVKGAAKVQGGSRVEGVLPAAPGLRPLPGQEAHRGPLPHTGCSASFVWGWKAQGALEPWTRLLAEPGSPSRDQPVAPTGSPTREKVEGLLSAPGLCSWECPRAGNGVTSRVCPAGPHVPGSVVGTPRGKGRQGCAGSGSCSRVRRVGRSGCGGQSVPGLEAVQHWEERGPHPRAFLIQERAQGHSPHACHVEHSAQPRGRAVHQGRPHLPSPPAWRRGAALWSGRHRGAPRWRPEVPVETAAGSFVQGAKVDG